MTIAHYYIVISQPSNPTGQPTSQPSSSLLQGLTFDFTHKFSNIDLVDWNADANHLVAYKESLLLHVPNLREDDVTNIAVRDTSVRRLLEEMVGVTMIHGLYDSTSRTLLSKSLEIIATISVRPQYYDKTGKSTLDSTYNQLVSDIQATSTSILAYLQARSTYFQPAVSSPMTFSSYSVTVLHSGFPTSTPTSQPSCGAGYVGDNVNCVPCEPGTFLSDFSKDTCEPCPLDYYSSTYGAAACTACPSPKGAYQVGSTDVCSSSKHRKLSHDTKRKEHKHTTKKDCLP